MNEQIERTNKILRRWLYASWFVLAAVASIATITAFQSVIVRAFYYDPVSVTLLGDDVIVSGRVIQQEALVSYAATVRNAATHEILCEGAGGPFTYLPDAKNAERDLDWWLGDTGCDPDGAYYLDTTWTVHSGLLGWLEPATSIRSNVYSETAK